VKILYVEDNEDNVYVIEQRLVKLGFTVLVAADGASGIAVAAAERPDLILMDLSLPAMDGWEATRRIKSSPATSHIPVIALTSHAMIGERERALRAGCDEFDTKPVDFARLLDKIHSLLARGRSR
jgi:two-component system cell cycle response regulator DivK